MAKRKNRLGPIRHEINQLENLKTLEPITTPPEHMPLSTALIDLVIASLEEVESLEGGNPPSSERLAKIQTLAQALNTQ